MLTRLKKNKMRIHKCFWVILLAFSWLVAASRFIYPREIPSGVIDRSTATRKSFLKETRSQSSDITDESVKEWGCTNGFRGSFSSEEIVMHSLSDGHLLKRSRIAGMREIDVELRMIESGTVSIGSIVQQKDGKETLGFRYPVDSSGKYRAFIRADHITEGQYPIRIIGALVLEGCKWIRIGSSNSSTFGKY